MQERAPGGGALRARPRIGAAILAVTPVPGVDARGDDDWRPVIALGRGNHVFDFDNTPDFGLRVGYALAPD